MCKMQPPLVCAGWNLYSLRKNPRFYLSLTLGFLLCWLLTDKTMQISRTYLTSVQLVEPFVWCYADGDSILYAALVLMLMLSALPRMDTPASYLIFRTTRRSWLIGQIITALIVTFGYCLMILLSSMLMCIGCNVYATNRWSETATMLSALGFELVERLVYVALVRRADLLVLYDGAYHLAPELLLRLVQRYERQGRQPLLHGADLDLLHFLLLCHGLTRLC